MASKICFKCGVEKELEEYYVHKGMGDGRLGKCKECTKKDTRSREEKLSSDPEWKEKERSRHREKYYRLEYRELHKPSKESKKKTIESYLNKFPEKYKAKNYSSNIKVPNGYHKHHWSYSVEHYKDIIIISSKDHMKAHRFIVYDQDTFMYRRYDNNELLDTKEKHESFIKICIETMED